MLNFRVRRSTLQLARIFLLRRSAALGAVSLLLAASIGQAQPLFQQTNLVSSVPGVAAFTDPNLKNPWGIAFSSSSPFWIANQVTATATLYNGAGNPFPIVSPLVVTIPAAGGPPSGPTGVVFNSTSDFVPGGIGPKALFIFATLNGTLAAWNPGINPTNAITAAAASDGAAYTGLALGNNGSGNFLYAADSANAKIDVYDASFAQTSLPGSFVDPGLPSGFTPYNVQNIGGTLLITYENEANGGGIVDAFDLNGNFLRRVTGNGAGGPLESPWGLALAPAGFDTFGGALLVGNEDDGRISAFDFGTGNFLGQLLDTSASPISNPGLWGLTFGNVGQGGDPNVLYFAAGIEDETQGLFGAIRPASIAAVPEPGTASLLLLAALALFVASRRRFTPCLPGADRAENVSGACRAPARSRVVFTRRGPSTSAAASPAR